MVYTKSKEEMEITACVLAFFAGIVLGLYVVVCVYKKCLNYVQWCYLLLFKRNSWQNLFCRGMSVLQLLVHTIYFP